MKKIIYIFLLFLSGIGWAQTCNFTISSGNGFGNFNLSGGTNSTGSDGLRVFFNANGNLQVRYKNSEQIYNNAQSGYSASGSPTAASTTYEHGIVISIGNNIYRGGTLYPNSGSAATNSFLPQPSAPSCNYSATTNTYTFTNTYSIVKNSLTYKFTFLYTYKFPEPFMRISYTVDIPTGNTEEVKVAHGWDASLAGSDNSPHFAIDSPTKTIVGTRNTTNGFQAFIYKSGTMWSGYYGASAANIKEYLGSGTTYGNFMEYSTKTVSTTSVDSSIAMSINYGTAAGVQSTTNLLSFQCNAPATAPTTGMFTPAPISTTASTSTYNLTCIEGSKSIVVPQTNFPVTDYDANAIRDVVMLFVNTTTNAEFTATYENGTVNLPAGTYNAYFYDTINGCVSPSRTIVINRPACPSDLSIVKTINTNSNSTVRLGNSYTITYVARNNGTNDNGGVIVTDNIPPGFTIVTPTPDAGTSYANGTWTIGSLAVNQSKTLTITVTANSYGGHTSTATISGASTDSTPANNISNPQIYIDYDNDGYGSNLDLDSDNDGILDATEYFLTNRVTSGVFVGTANANTDNVPGWTVGGTYATAGTWLPGVGRVHLKTDGIEFRRDKGTTTTLSQNISNISGGIITLQDLYWYKTSDGTVDTDFTFTISYNGTVYAIINSTLTNTPTITTYNGATVNTATLPTVTATATPTTGVKSALSTIKITMPVTLTKTNGLLSFQFVAGADNTNVRDLGMKSIAVETYRDFDNDGIPDFLDLDSDGDGCFDAREGSQRVPAASLNPNGSITGTVAANGVPALVGVGQAAGTAYNSGISECLDTDGDGIPDYIDLDSDNDGILDYEEIVSCSTPTYKKQLYKQDFGSQGVHGIRLFPFSITEGSTGLTFKTTTPTGDTYYSITTNTTLVDDFSPGYNDQWSKVINSPDINNIENGILDHTVDASGIGLMAIFNPQNNTSVIWKSPVVSVKPGAAIETSLWLMRINPDSNYPNLNIKIFNADTNTQIGNTLNTGDFVSRIVWTEKSIILPVGTNTSAKNIYIEITSNVNSGQGNDFALDDIIINELYCDTDNDGNPNYLDLDSDGDGCFDAIEGGDNVIKAQLNPNGSINYSAYGGVNGNGIPNLVNPSGAADKDGFIGQTANFAYDGISSCPTFCLKPATTTGTALDTNVGISTIGTTAGWPQNRKGAYLALESQGKGFVISRLTTTQITAIGVNSQEGMMVYDTDVDCLKIYSKDIGAATYSWKCFDTQSCPDNL